ncbi:MAG TPA: DUF6062 family protein [Planctomycetota bacterium]|nr:DUF6062 family protein [Planctomycetota bacterium]HRR83196.1 DUF6062 family protein [Planctomycetota bacterium]HRT94951.1 DUF6062 family protein [Planctomycetota bacterium]
MAKHKEKHLPYHIVLEALRQAAGCPLCSIEVEGTKRYLDGLLYESVNDPGVRRSLRASRGYCPRHAHTLAGFKSGLGTAILYRDQVELFLDFLKALRQPGLRRLRPSATAAWSKRAQCPACHLEAESRERHAAILIEGLADDEEMRAAFDACPGLCVPHFLFVYDRIGDSGTRGYLWEVQQRKLAALQGELDDFIARHDYRRIKDGFGEVGDSWVRALQLMAGQEGGQGP